MHQQIPLCRNTHRPPRFSAGRQHPDSDVLRPCGNALPLRHNLVQGFRMKCRKLCCPSGVSVRSPHFSEETWTGCSPHSGIRHQGCPFRPQPFSTHSSLSAVQPYIRRGRLRSRSHHILSFRIPSFFCPLSLVTNPSGSMQSLQIPLPVNRRQAAPHPAPDPEQL